MSSVASSPPEQGQLVSVRSRQWIVTEVAKSTPPPTALKPDFSGPQNLLTLASVEDDGLGEELQVIWEIEPGARVIEKVALPEPTGFDPPDKLDAFLDADVKNIQATSASPQWRLKWQRTRKSNQPSSRPQDSFQKPVGSPMCCQITA
jgi:hypothetical protein